LLEGASGLYPAESMLPNHCEGNTNLVYNQHNYFAQNEKIGVELQLSVS